MPFARIRLNKNGFNYFLYALRTLLKILSSLLEQKMFFFNFCIFLKITVTLTFLVTFVFLRDFKICFFFIYNDVYAQVFRAIRIVLQKNVFFDPP